MKQVPSMIKEGYYRVTITHVTNGKDASTKNGPEKTIRVAFRTESGERVSTQILLTDYSTLWNQLLEVTAMQGKPDLTERDFIDKTCGIEIKHYFTGSNVYANVVDICHLDELVEDSEAEEE